MVDFSARKALKILANQLEFIAQQCQALCELLSDILILLKELICNEHNFDFVSREPHQCETYFGSR